MIAQIYFRHLKVQRARQGVQQFVRTCKTSIQHRKVLPTEIIRPPICPRRLTQIKRLLYDVYIKEQKWEFSSTTPSRIWVDHNNRLFHDKFMDSSTWFLVVRELEEEADILGCGRVIESVPAEVFGYRDSAIGGQAIKTLHEKYGDNGVVEMNRLAVSSKARTPDVKVAVDVVVAVFHYLALQENDDRPLIATAARNSWVPGFIKNIPGVGDVRERFGEPFFYEDTDQEPVQMYLAHRDLMRKSIGKYLVHPSFNNFL